ncbi:MAG: ribbon-helix-helix protein, CopG family [Burkholderiaceae bacterium]
MGRLTISLKDDLHQALKETAARQGRSIGKIIEEGLELRGVKPMTPARDLLMKARRSARRTEEKAIELAVKEVRASRSRSAR